MNWLNWLQRLQKIRPGQGLVVGVPYAWLVMMFLVPFLIVLKISVAEQELAIPPYSPLYAVDPDFGRLNITLNYLNYSDIFNNFFSSIADVFEWQFNGGESKGSNLYVLTYWLSLRTALATTLICLLIGYPMAYAIARAPENMRNGLLLAVMLPFWTSFLLRVYAWISLLGNNGLINTYLMRWGLIQEPLDMFYNNFSLILVMVYAYLPFMVLPLYTHLVKQDGRLLEASADLGAGPIKSFLTITLPLSKAGIIAGSMLVFIPSVGEYVIPELVGGSENLMIGKMLWMAFFDENNWPKASAIAVTMVLLLVVPIALFHRYESRQLEGEPGHA